MQRLPPTVLALGVTLGAVTATSPALAEEEASPEVIVTGTRLKDRTVLDSPVPVDVLSSDDLRSTGALAGELGQALQSLAPSFNFPRQSNSGGADHVRAAQLRGMSPDQVLVLVNGKRRHTSSVVNLEAKIGKGTTPVDFNSIPLNAIGRIEVLRDGAGAQYGSDAIAGVINVILDDAASGSEAVLTFGQNVTSFQPTGQSLSDGETWVAQVKQGFAIGDGGYLSLGAEYRDRASTNRSGFDTLIFQADPTPANLATEGQRNYRPGDAQTKDVDFWFNSRRPLPSGAEVYAFGTYAHRKSVGAAFFRYPDSSQNLTGIYPAGYRPESLGTNQDLGLTGGAAGALGEWSWDTSLTFGRNKFEYGLRNSLNASLGPTSPTRFRIGTYEIDQLTLNVDAARPLEVAALERPLNLAVGAELRREEFGTRAGDAASYAAGPFTDFDPGAQAGPGLTPADEANTHRTVGSAYVDLSASITDDFFVDLAGRFEDHSDFGSAVAGKLSAWLHLAPGFALRGAVSNSFRAPSLSQVAFRSTSTSFGEGGVLAQVLTLPVSDPLARALGAADLDAEKSVNVSFGLTYAPLDELNFAVDVFRIKVKDRITISERISGGDLTSFIEDAFGVTGVDGINFFTNAVDTSTKGVDFVASYASRLAVGTLRLTGAFSYAQTRIDGVRDEPQQLADLGFDDVIIGVEERNTLVDAAPKTRTILTGNWSSQRWNLVSRLTRYGSAVRVFNFGGGFEPRQEYGAKNQLDLEAEFKPRPNIGLALGGTNVLDEYPDRSIEDIAYAGNLPYDVLSPIGFNGAFFYARARVTFQ